MGIIRSVPGPQGPEPEPVRGPQPKPPAPETHAQARAYHQDQVARVDAGRSQTEPVLETLQKFFRTQVPANPAPAPQRHVTPRPLAEPIPAPVAMIYGGPHPYQPPAPRQWQPGPVLDPHLKPFEMVVIYGGPSPRWQERHDPAPVPPAPVDPTPVNPSPSPFISIYGGPPPQYDWNRNLQPAGPMLIYGGPPPQQDSQPSMPMLIYGGPPPTGAGHHAAGTASTQSDHWD